MHVPWASTQTCSAVAGSCGSSMRMCAGSAPPMSASPSVSRCTLPAAGPPATWISTTPAGSGPMQPEASPRLTTQPGRIRESRSACSGGTSTWSTYTEVAAAERGPGNARTCPGLAAAGTAPACRKRSSSSASVATGVAGSASSSTSACRLAAGDTTVSASRIVVLPGRAEGGLPPAVPPRRPAVRSRPSGRHFFSAAASWVSVSWKALAAALRYWAMPFRPSIILRAPWVNSV